MPAGASMGLPGAAAVRRSKRLLSHQRSVWVRIGAGVRHLPRSNPRLLAQATIRGNQGSRRSFRWL